VPTVTFPTEREWLAARHFNVNSTEVAALFGMSPFSTAYELAIQKTRGEPPVFEDTERMKWGRRLQDTIAQGIADDYGLVIEGMHLEYGTHDSGVRLGSSFDYRMLPRQVPGKGVLHEMLDNLGAGILEIKNVDGLQFKRGWEDGEAPAHYEIQLQTQLEVLGLNWGVIAAFVGGNRTELIIRERDRKVGAAIVTRVAKFWKDIGEGILPPPVMPQDAAFVISLYQYAEPNAVYDGQDDAEFSSLLQEYMLASKQVSESEKHQRVLKARIFERIGSAEKALASGFKLSAAMVAPAEVKAYVRAGYRGLRVSEVRT
jgi:predicted phage-related endonuclease